MEGAVRRAAAAARRRRLGGHPGHDNDATVRSRSRDLLRCSRHGELYQRSARPARRRCRGVGWRTSCHHVAAELEDFGDTAAVLKLCDLVIAVDTAAAHLAGAMGRPVWVLLPFAPDWRWALHGEPRRGIRPRGCSGRLRRRLGGVIARVGAALAASYKLSAMISRRLSALPRAVAPRGRVDSCCAATSLITSQFSRIYA